MIIFVGGGVCTVQCYFHVNLRLSLGFDNIVNNNIVVKSNLEKCVDIVRKTRKHVWRGMHRMYKEAISVYMGHLCIAQHPGDSSRLQLCH